MVSRTLWLKDNDKDIWKWINVLMDNLEYQKEDEKIARSVIDLIYIHSDSVHRERNTTYHGLKTTYLNTHKIHTGVLDTHAYIVGENAEKDVHLQGVV